MSKRASFHLLKKYDVPPLLIKSVWKDHDLVDIFINEHYFQKIAKSISLDEVPKNTRVIDGAEKAIIPPFYNAHTHAAMTLLRGYADDMSLFKWLSEYIWPLEAKLTREDVYWGSRLAILEMIKSGTVFFSDMYWNREETIRAVIEMGVRATIGVTFAENLMSPKSIEDNFDFLEKNAACHERIQLAVMPHAVYTVGDVLWRRCAETAQRLGLVLHTHLAETTEEVENCIQKTGKTPVQYLDSLGVLNQNVVLAHAIHLTPEDIDILQKRDVTLVHNPSSNMKLSSGKMNISALMKAGIPIALGTDGASSNNNLDMREEMKFAALLAKVDGGPELLSADEVFHMATVQGSRAYQVNAGLIEEGKLADAILLDLNNERLIPNHHLVSNWVYAADARCIDKVICHGQILMENKSVENEIEILERVKKFAAKN